jgi:predicted hydrocarbon binding protein
VAHLDDGPDHYIVTLETDFCSAGKQSDTPIGWLFEAAIEESGRTIYDKFFDVVQVQCRSMGHATSIWHVPKQPS